MSNVTIKDIALAAGVSHPTVSKALNNSPGVGADTRERILKLAQQMDYVPNIAAKRLANKKNRSIGFIWPEIEGLFFYHLCNALQKEALKLDIDVFVSMSDPVKALRNFNEHFIDFVLCWFPPNWLPKIDFIKERDLFKGEITIIGGGQMENASTVFIDRSRGIYDAVSYLASIGHKRVAFIGDQTDKNNGYIKGILENHMEYFHDYMVITDTGYYHSMEISRKELGDKFNALWYSDHKPTAIILDSQGSAFVMINILNELKISIPADLSVICYDDIPELSIYPVSLTTCGSPIPKIASIVINNYERFFQGGSMADSYREVIIPELKIQESTRSL